MWLDTETILIYSDKIFFSCTLGAQSFSHDVEKLRNLLVKNKIPTIYPLAQLIEVGFYILYFNYMHFQFRIIIYVFN